MRDPKQAQALLAMAYKDLRALRAMSDADAFHDEIFGFHCQQSTEKALKAWLALLGLEYPLTHDLSVLLGRLESHGLDVEPYWDLVEYNAFAVRFRYESLDSWDQPLDRVAALTAVEHLVRHVHGLIGPSEAS
jgi:HEPN domain-containing protein